MSKHTALCADLDGTLAVIGPRNVYDDQKCYCDTVNEKVQSVILALRSWTDLKLIFMSGRQDRSRDETVRWLNDKAGFAPGTYELFMRATGDNRADDIVKEELYRFCVLPRYDVWLVLDDRDRVVSMWRRLGLTCFQVAEGKF
jgi:hypothetical protein